MSTFSFKKSKSIRKKGKEAILPHIKFYFAAGQAKPEPPLGPAIAMFQLNMAQVCKDLNEASVVYEPGVLVAAKVFKKAARVHTLKLGVPPFKFLLETALLAQIPVADLEAFNETASADDIPSFSFPTTLPISVFYDVVRVHAAFLGLGVRQTAKTVFATLGSMRPKMVRSFDL